MEEYIKGAEQVSLFCRLNLNTKPDFPIRSCEMGLLIYAIKKEKPFTPLQAANFFRVSKPMITSMVKSLHSEGYLLKSPLETDKRSYIIVPTKKAYNLVDKTYDEYHKKMKLLQNKLGQEKYKSLIDLLYQANLILLEERKK